MALKIVQEMLNNVATQRVRNTAVPTVMASGRPACLGARRGSRDGLPAFTGATPVIRFHRRFLGVQSAVPVIFCTSAFARAAASRRLRP